MAEFNLPPISVLAGSSLRNYVKAIAQNRIESQHYLKVFLTFLIVLISMPFRYWDKLKYGGKVKSYKFEEPPVFVLGHWRSGTTYLHNLLCQDPRAGFLTTYHSLFPHNLGSKWIFQTFLRLTMPEKRPSDNVKLSVEYPQEDEFCIGNIHTFCYYYFLYFPDRSREFYEKYVRFNVSEDVRAYWKKTFKELVIKALIETSGSRAVFKNPVMVGRVRELVEIFPDARFVSIHRNPIIVYLSTKKFFLELFPTLWFHEISEEEIVELLLETFEKIIHDYEENKRLIPKGHLIELNFESFEDDPIPYLKRVYEKAHLPNFVEAKPYFERYVASKKNYKKNNYVISRNELEIVQKRWGFAMELWGYDIPENLDIVD